MEKNSRMTDAYRVRLSRKLLAKSANTGHFNRWQKMPKVSYETEALAVEALTTHGHKQGVAYQCRLCHLWHISSSGA
jgi:hypothetical protein